jgi:peptidoglycan/LPS O-acetylase OafA/YrhL
MDAATSRERVDEERPRTTSPARTLGSVPALDGFRGVAVLVVMLYHSAYIAPWFRGHIIDDGLLGVDMFFVLSGFLITALLLGEQARRHRTRLGAFYRRRALRLLPALIVLLIAHSIYALVTDLPGGAERSSVLSVLFYYSNTAVRTGPTAFGLGHLWSLAVEEQFYVVWPLCLVLLLGIRRRTATVVALMIGAIAIVAIHRTIVFHDGVTPLLAYSSTPLRIDSLLVGALLAQCWVRGVLPKRGLQIGAWLSLVFVAYAIGHGMSWAFYFEGGFTLIAVAFAIMIAALLETSWSLRRVLTLAPLRSMGRVSYGLYIWHLPVWFAVARATQGWSDPARFTLAIVLTALPVALSWHLVERPFLRLKDRLEARAAPPVGHLAVTPPATVAAEAV